MVYLCIILMYCFGVMEIKGECKKEAKKIRHETAEQRFERLQNYEEYLEEFCAFYDTKDVNNKERRLQFEVNVGKIKEWNIEYKKGNKSFGMVINHITGWLPDERRHLNPNYRSNKYCSVFKFNYIASQSTPENLDWRSKGIVSPVKQQGRCGSCYAFAVSAAVESHVAKNYGYYNNLSPQMIIDCSTKTNGCKGGLIQNTFDWVMQNGISRLKNYPYEAKQGECRADDDDNDETRVLTRMKKYVAINPGDEEGLKVAVASIGPVAVGIDASLHSLQHYSEGVYDDEKCSDSRMTHAAVVVGYGKTSSGKEYWLVKNSWGKHWGDHGYIKIARNQNNLCGIATEAYVPDMDGTIEAFPNCPDKDT